MARLAQREYRGESSWYNMPPVEPDTLIGRAKECVPWLAVDLVDRQKQGKIDNLGNGLFVYVWKVEATSKYVL